MSRPLPGFDIAFDHGEDGVRLLRLDVPPFLEKIKDERRAIRRRIQVRLFFD